MSNTEKGATTPLNHLTLKFRRS